MWQTLLSPIADLIGGYFRHKSVEKVAKHEARLEVIRTNANWESKMADASAASWKDEFWTLILALPIFMVGYAIAVDDVTVIERVSLGFRALSELPEYYQYLLFLAISASFGIKGADKLMQLKKNKNGV